MFKDKKPLIIISVTVIIILVVSISRPREIDWSPTFSAADKIPYGNYILYHSLGDIFGQGHVKMNSEPVYQLLHGHEYENTSLIFVQEYFRPAPLDTRELLSFAANGNDIFISAHSISGHFSDTLQLNEESVLKHDALNPAKKDTSEITIQNLTNPQLKSDSGFRFKKEVYATYYDVHDTSFLQQADTAGVPDITVLGTDGEHHPTFIRIRYGKGNIYLHNYPYAFSNYYMLKPANSEYIARCFSYLQNDHVIWDEFYKKGEDDLGSPLSFILSREPLHWAYYLAMLSLLIFILFNVKRRQRIIPVVEPYRNTSLEFTQIVGALYFHQSGHLDICLKKINYFLEFVRNRYNIATTELSSEFITRLSYKSGISQERVEHLIAVMTGLQKKQWVSDIELIDLNSLIEYFKTNCQ